MRFAWRVQPRNYLLFACHATNATAQAVQLYRFGNYHYLGGKQIAQVKDAAHKVQDKAAGAVENAKDKAVVVKDKALEVAHQAQHKAADVAGAAKAKAANASANANANAA